MRHTAIGSVVFLGAILSAFAAPPAGPPDVKTAIDLLASPDYRAREKAGADLLALGDRGLPALKAALPTLENPEANRRLQVIVKKLDDARLMTPRRVTFKVVNKPVKEILTRIGQEAGYPIKVDGDSADKLRLSFTFTDLPFWEALDTVCDAAGVTINQQDDDGTMSATFSDSYNPHVSYSGPFKVTATSINIGRAIQLAGLNRKQPVPRQPEYMGLSFTITGESKAPMVGIGVPVITKAIDETGTNLLPTELDQGPQQSLYPPPQAAFKSYNQGFGTNLSRAERSATTIKELRGTIPVLILAETRPELVVENVMKSKKKKFPGSTVDLEVTNVEFAGGVLTAELTFRQRHGDPDDFSWTNGLQQRIEVFDAAGKRYQSNGVSNQSNGPGTTTMQMQFSAPEAKKLGEPARLRVVEWVTVARDIPFTFKDLPMP